MTEMLEIASNGALNSIQDLGRYGVMDIGVSRSGAMDSLALKLGNALVGNSEDAAGIEITIFPFKVQFLEATRIALTGAECGAMLNGQAVPAWWTVPVKPGQVLTLSRPADGARAYLCVAGGLDVPLVLGSRSTDLKAGFGGFAGRALRKGDRIGAFTHETTDAPVSAMAPSGSGPSNSANAFSRRGLKPPAAELALTFPLTRPGSDGAGKERADAADDDVFVRVLPAAEYDSFPPAARKTFWSSRWKITNNSNRIGYRLEGPALAASGQAELLSHGIVPGVIQIPAGGQPIIQMSDANTAGGYPKIGVVIEPDLWRIGQAQLGRHLRFVEVTLEEGLAAFRKQRAYVEAIRHSLNLAPSKESR